MKTTTRIFRVFAVAAIAVLTMAACASTRTQKSAGEQIDDSMITGKINAELIGDPVTTRRTRSTSRCSRAACS